MLKVKASKNNVKYYSKSVIKKPCTNHMTYPETLISSVKPAQATFGNTFPLDTFNVLPSDDKTTDTVTLFAASKPQNEAETASHSKRPLDAMF